MSPALGINRVRCHYCSRQVPIWEVHQFRAAQTICGKCLEAHMRALEFLGGGPVPGCHECGDSWETLREKEKTANVRLYVVPKDSMLQTLCAICVRKYLPKRPDLFKDTEFGFKSLKL